MEFKIIPVEQIPSYMEKFKNISDRWLALKNTREKGFGLGFFSQDYLKNFPAAIVISQGKLIAFANLWLGAGKKELSVDLMRYLPGSHEGIMDYLFTELMLWGKEQGYGQFNLGMAPLSGLEGKNLASLWPRFGNFVFRYGENFYNFQGLRKYKEKFDPVWQSKYIVCPGGLAVPRILSDTLAITSRGIKGSIAK
jgi:phosphatidylglycerol lysyltransferase